MSGLRGRLLLALVVTSLATLAAAAFVTFSPVERRVIADRRDELHDLARTVRPVLRELPERDRRAGSPALLKIVERLQARTGGRILLYDQQNRTLADTSSLGDDAQLVPPAVLRARAQRRRDGVYTGEQGDRVFAATVAGAPQPLLLVVSDRLDDGRAAAAVLRSAAPLALGVGVGVALLLGLLLSRRLSRRLETLRSDAAALGTEGLTHPVVVSGRDEVTVVARALERMRTQLIDEQNARLQFLATASHELRTPLASLQAGLELLREELDRGSADPGAVTEHADRALRQTRRLSGLATDLLDLSRIDGGVALRAEPIELHELVAMVVSEFAARMAIAGRPLELEGGAALVYADATATARIIRILLDNADHYGDGRVSVSIEVSPEQVTLTVADEGDGIGDDEREAVFQRFSRGRAGAGSSAGAGLGLAIARGLARAMGGELEARPSTTGARLVLTLPAA